MAGSRSLQKWLTGLAALVARARGADRIAILTYHRVLPAPDPLLPEEPDAAVFDWQMQVLAQHFRPMTVAQAMDRLAARSLPRGAVCVTFDDGYADNVSVALPILRRWNIAATFFIATGFLDGGRMFNDTVIETVRRIPGDILHAPWLGLTELAIHDVEGRRHALQALIGALKYRPPPERTSLAERLAAELRVPLPNDLMMTRDQVCTLRAAGMSVGAHTRMHPILANIDPGAARAEIDGGREELESILRDRIEVFAYPNGRPQRDYAREHVMMVRDAGFRYAVSTAWGPATARSDPLQLPRIAPLGRRPGEFAVRLVRAGFSARATVCPA